MKKWLKTYLLTVVVLVLCFVVLPNYAQAASESDLTFTLNNDGESYSVSDCSTAASGDLVIPAVYNGMPVTSIGNDAFYQCTKLTNITIPESIASIGKSAFAYCSSLTNISIPDGIDSLEFAVFSRCYSLSSVSIPNSVNTIGRFAFEYCSSLTDISFWDGLNIIDEYAFASCSALTNISIPGSVNTIKRLAFSGCEALATVTIDEGVSIIEDYAFYQCVNLLEIEIPDSLSSMGTSVFGGCTSLTSVKIGKGITHISNFLFEDCTSLSNIIIQDGVTLIGCSTFKGCTSLHGITLPDSVTTIEASAFEGCVNLSDVIIPNGVTYIGHNAFSYCSSLTSITIPDSVTSFGNGPFRNCNNLQSITIGRGVTQIPGDAFNSCTSLQSVVVPNSVEYIDGHAFYGCTSLQSITIPDRVFHIGQFAFYGCTNLTDVYYSGTKIQWSQIFIDNYNEPFINATVHFPPEIIAYGTFWKLDDEGTLTILGSSEIYPPDFNNIPWKDYTASIKNVVIEKYVFNISYTAFYNCPNLSGIWVDENNDNYSSDCFGVLYNKDKTKLLQAPTALNGNYTILDGVKLIDARAFYNCIYLKDIIIPNSVNTISIYAFFNCSSLHSVTIPNSVTNIGQHAFADCTSLRNITIPNSVTDIVSYAFYGCKKLQAVFYIGTEKQKNDIDIGSHNDDITNTQWHYEITDHYLGLHLAHHCKKCDLYYRNDGSGANFTDISFNSWQLKSVNYAFVRGLMEGKGTDANGNIKFDPNSPITREEFVQVLYNAENKPSVIFANNFPDVVNNAWYKNAVLWANSKNIANGMGNGKFGVGMNISRQDLALMLYKYAAMKNLDLTAPTGQIDQYADGSRVSGYAQTAMNWAVKNGVLSGKGTAGADISTFRLDPTGTATRAECAAMLKNFMEAFGL